LVNRRQSSQKKNAPRVNTPNRLKVSGVRSEVERQVNRAKVAFDVYETEIFECENCNF